ncbi:Tetratricopeptide repeat-containing protein [Halovenus aranensis]|uniref:Tetratricopeptide repeat-containing protein n=1 Tax=Halovenus aranensis TaxID=890420 RepID=A0A1G8WKQ0_9EURY|nr:tetratricopeptide repeat protein [Halovenus aranensis]SDJ78909.1 Tetratricopeptide repeat-containing protein [Halovenus aranensis]
MDGYTETDFILSALFEAGATSPEGRIPLSTVLKTVVPDSSQFSAKTNVAVSIDRLTTQGLVTRTEESDGTISLSLTARGEPAARTVHEAIAEETITVADEEEARTVRAVASTVEDTTTAVAVACTDGDAYYRSETPDTEFIDREDERAEWQQVVDECTEHGRGAAVAVSGPRGIGKTTLVEECVADVQSRDDIDVVRVDAKQTDEPYGPLRTFVDRAGGENDMFAVDSEWETLRSQTGQEGELDSYEAGQTGLFYGITQQLEPAHGHRILVLEDSHESDRGTQSYLEYLLGQLSELSLILLCTSTVGSGDTVVTDGGPLDDERVTQFELSRFGRRETARLVQQTVGRRDVPDSFVELVHDQSGGTPLYAELLIEELLETEALDPDFRWYPTDADDIDLSTAIEDAVSRQLESLTPAGRELVTWASLCHEPIDTAVLASVTSVEPNQLSTAFDVLTGAGILERDPDGDLVFTTAVTKEVAQSRLTDTQRRDRHRALATALRTEYEPDDTTDDHGGVERRIGSHYQNCGQQAVAAEWYKRAAESAAAVYAHETAIAEYNNALTLAREGDNSEQLLDIVTDLAEIYCLVGEYDAAERHIAFLEERIEPGEQQRSQYVCWLRARVANVKGEYEAAEKSSRDGLSVSGLETEAECRLLSTLTESQLMRSEFEAARTTAEQLRTIAEEGGVQRYTTESYAKLAKIELQTENYDQAAEYTQTGLDSCDFTQNTRTRIRLLNMRGTIKREIGAFGQAREAVEEALPLAREIGDKFNEGRLLVLLAGIAMRTGRMDEALTHAEEALSIQNVVGDRFGQAGTANIIAAVNSYLGNRESAVRKWRQALDIAHEIDNKTLICGVSFNLGVNFRQMGELEKAIDRYREVLDIVENSEVEQTKAETLLGLARVYNNQGEYRQAIEYAEQSLALSEEHGHSYQTLEERLVLGSAYHHAGLYAEARDSYETALEMSRQHELDHYICQSLLSLGAVAQEQDEHETAADYFQQATAIIDDIDRVKLIATYHLRYSQFQAEQAAYETALEHVARAERALSREEWPYYEARAQRQAARIMLETGDIATAEPLATAAIDTFDEIGAVHHLAKAQLLKADIAATAGDIDQAHGLARRALDTITSVTVPHQNRSLLL